MAAGRGNEPARESSDRLDRDSAKQPEKGDVNELVKELWGHLPERSREQMMQSFSEEFLPKYEREIQQYYRRLSEEQRPIGGTRTRKTLPRRRSQKVPPRGFEPLSPP